MQTKKDDIKEIKIFQYFTNLNVKNKPEKNNYLTFPSFYL